MGWVETLMRCVEIVACGSPPARGISELVSLAQADQWDPFVTLSPSATKWASIAHLERQTGYPVRTEFRTPDEELPVPASDAVVACPVTVNTVNKWAAGICDTLALWTRRGDRPGRTDRGRAVQQPRTSRASGVPQESPRPQRL